MLDAFCCLFWESLEQCVHFLTFFLFKVSNVAGSIESRLGYTDATGWDLR